MSSFEVHCEDCVRELGKPYADVHNWLDELWEVLGAEHRDIRHNVLGVEKVREMWGDEAARAAEIHIEADELCIPEIDATFKIRIAMRPDIHKVFVSEYSDHNIKLLGRFDPR